MLMLIIGVGAVLVLGAAVVVAVLMSRRGRTQQPTSLMGHQPHQPPYQQQYPAMPGGQAPMQQPGQAPMGQPPYPAAPGQAPGPYAQDPQDPQDPQGQGSYGQTPQTPQGQAPGPYGQNPNPQAPNPYGQQPPHQGQ
ncbi:hypothetical protein RCO28_12250 [Streptomyces sp. LHD-70]|uniref:hypothetical protein n=1 Tax=Streptomyces sp. LHD-70 TaxID=3072140 RepID=UPI00280E5F4F|nr:hypothetical protein [Streptomyces sp. LHD-70]MDQ8703254.1 hypothetical protein [Streptomyces sp. LHD-70]